MKLTFLVCVSCLQHILDACVHDGALGDADISCLYVFSTYYMLVWAFCMVVLSAMFELVISCCVPGAPKQIPDDDGLQAC